MEIKYYGTDELKPYEMNAKKHDQRQIDNVAESIRQFGWKQPLVIDKDNTIVIGHCRWEAAKKLGLEEVPCVVADELTEDEIKRLRIVDNKSNESEWDIELLAADLETIDMTDFDFEGLDFVDEEESTGKIVEDDFEVDLPEEPTAQIGKIYELGGHRLICGDSTDPAVIDRLMDGVKADMVFTDPPYGMNAVSKSGVLSEHYKTDIMNEDDNTVAIDAFNLAREYFKDAKQIWWGANYYTECLPSSECWIVWDKNNGASDQTDCELAWTNIRSVVRQFTMASEKTNRVHPTQKPCKLFEEILHKFDKDNSVKYVVDLFGGSGSTLIACEQLSRKCYMCELDPKYVDVIIKRWEKFTGKKAVEVSL